MEKFINLRVLRIIMKYEAYFFRRVKDSKNHLMSDETIYYAIFDNLQIVPGLPIGITQKGFGGFLSNLIGDYNKIRKHNLSSEEQVIVTPIFTRKHKDEKLVAGGDEQIFHTAEIETIKDLTRLLNQNLKN